MLSKGKISIFRRRAADPDELQTTKRQRHLGNWNWNWNIKAPRFIPVYVYKAIIYLCKYTEKMQYFSFFLKGTDQMLAFVLKAAFLPSYTTVKRWNT
jgi:hypothetical protein